MFSDNCPFVLKFSKNSFGATSLFMHGISNFQCKLKGSQMRVIEWLFSMPHTMNLNYYFMPAGC